MEPREEFLPLNFRRGGENGARQSRKRNRPHFEQGCEVAITFVSGFSSSEVFHSSGVLGVHSVRYVGRIVGKAMSGRKDWFHLHMEDPAESRRHDRPSLQGCHAALLHDNETQARISPRLYVLLRGEMDPHSG